MAKKTVKKKLTKAQRKEVQIKALKKARKALAKKRQLAKDAANSEAQSMGFLGAPTAPVKTPVKVDATETSIDDQLVETAHMTFMDAVRELRAEDGVKIQAPKEYSDNVIGETMLSVMNSLRAQSQHDVVLAMPQLIKDLVDQAYARGVMSVQNANSN